MKQSLAEMPSKDKKCLSWSALKERGCLSLLDRLGDGGDEGGDFGVEIRMSSKFADPADDGAADDDSVAFLRDFRCLFGGGNAESHGDGEVRVGFDFANLGTDACGKAGLLAGDAFA